MTWEELNKVRELTKDLSDAERTLEVMKLAVASAKVPVRDGLPKATTVSSRVEIMTVRIVDLTAKIERLKNELADAVRTLETQILQTLTDKTAQKLFVLRYVDCMYFNDIAFALGYSETHIYYLHDKFIEFLIDDKS